MGRLLRRGLATFSQLQSGSRILDRVRAGTRQRNGGVWRYSRRRCLAGHLHDHHDLAGAAQGSRAAVVGLISATKKFLAILWCCLGSESVAGNVFGDHARDDKLQEVIGAAGFGTAAAHFESTERVTSDNRARA